MPRPRRNLNKLELDFTARVERILVRHGCRLVSRRLRDGWLELTGGHPYGLEKTVRIRVDQPGLGHTDSGTAATASDVGYQLQNRGYPPGGRRSAAPVVPVKSSEVA